jgi:hypothetical protein
MTKNFPKSPGRITFRIEISLTHVHISLFEAQMEHNHFVKDGMMYSKSTHNIHNGVNLYL